VTAAVRRDEPMEAASGTCNPSSPHRLGCAGILRTFGIELQKMKCLNCIFASTVVGLLLTPALVGAPKQTVVVISGPTVIAFFPLVTPAELNNDPDTNEALADFQFCAKSVRKPLHNMGVSFEEIYGPSFRVQVGARITTFRPGKVNVGYYFAAPNRKPRIEYGVLTGVDLRQIASEYFGLSVN
jgi:hypothetical protein